MATKLTYTNAESQQKDLTPWNHINGCKVFKNDVDDTLLFMQLRDDNTCVVDAIEGYTELYQINSGIGSNAIGLIESKIDVSNYVNAGSITKFNFENVDNLQLFGEEVDESHIRYYLYNQIIDDKCLRKTLDKLGITYLVDDDGNVIINDNTLLLV